MPLSPIKRNKSEDEARERSLFKNSSQGSNGSSHEQRSAKRIHKKRWLDGIDSSKENGTSQRKKQRDHRTSRSFIRHFQFISGSANIKDELSKSFPENALDLDDEDLKAYICTKKITVHRTISENGNIDIKIATNPEELSDASDDSASWRIGIVNVFDAYIENKFLVDRSENDSKEDKDQLEVWRSGLARIARRSSIDAGDIINKPKTGMQGHASFTICTSTRRVLGGDTEDTPAPIDLVPPKILVSSEQAFPLSAINTNASFLDMPSVVNELVESKDDDCVLIYEKKHDETEIYECEDMVLGSPLPSASSVSVPDPPIPNSIESTVPTASRNEDFEPAVPIVCQSEERKDLKADLFDMSSGSEIDALAPINIPLPNKSCHPSVSENSIANSKSKDKRSSLAEDYDTFDVISVRNLDDLGLESSSSFVARSSVALPNEILPKVPGSKVSSAHASKRPKNNDLKEEPPRRHIDAPNSSHNVNVKCQAGAKRPSESERSIVVRVRKWKLLPIEKYLVSDDPSNPQEAGLPNPQGRQAWLDANFPHISKEKPAKRSTVPRNPDAKCSVKVPHYKQSTRTNDEKAKHVNPMKKTAAISPIVSLSSPPGISSTPSCQKKVKSLITDLPVNCIKNSNKGKPNPDLKSYESSKNALSDRASSKMLSPSNVSPPKPSRSLTPDTISSMELKQHAYKEKESLPAVSSENSTLKARSVVLKSQATKSSQSLTLGKITSTKSKQQDHKEKESLPAVSPENSTLKTHSVVHTKVPEDSGSVVSKIDKYCNKLNSYSPTQSTENPRNIDLALKIGANAVPKPSDSSCVTSQKDEATVAPKLPEVSVGVLSKIDKYCNKLNSSSSTQSTENPKNIDLDLRTGADAVPKPSDGSCDISQKAKVTVAPKLCFPQPMLALTLDLIFHSDGKQATDGDLTTHENLPVVHPTLAEDAVEKLLVVDPTTNVLPEAHSCALKLITESYRSPEKEGGIATPALTTKGDEAIDESVAELKNETILSKINSVENQLNEVPAIASHCLPDGAKDIENIISKAAPIALTPASSRVSAVDKPCYQEINTRLNSAIDTETPDVKTLSSAKDVEERCHSSDSVPCEDDIVKNRPLHLPSNTCDNLPGSHPAALEIDINKVSHVDPLAVCIATSAAPACQEVCYSNNDELFATYESANIPTIPASTAKSCAALENKQGDVNDQEESKNDVAFDGNVCMSDHLNADKEPIPTNDERESVDGSKLWDAFSNITEALSRAPSAAIDDKVFHENSMECGTKESSSLRGPLIFESVPLNVDEVDEDTLSHLPAANSYESLVASTHPSGNVTDDESSPNSLSSNCFFSNESSVLIPVLDGNCNSPQVAFDLSAAIKVRDVSPVSSSLCANSDTSTFTIVSETISTYEPCILLQPAEPTNSESLNSEQVLSNHTQHLKAEAQDGSSEISLSVNCLPPDDLTSFLNGNETTCKLNNDTSMNSESLFECEGKIIKEVSCSPSCDSVPITKDVEQMSSISNEIMAKMTEPYSPSNLGNDEEIIDLGSKLQENTGYILTKSHADEIEETNAQSIDTSATTSSTSDIARVSPVPSPLNDKDTNLMAKEQVVDFHLTSNDDIEVKIPDMITNDKEEDDQNSMIQPIVEGQESSLDLPCESDLGTEKTVSVSPNSLPTLPEFSSVPLFNDCSSATGVAQLADTVSPSIYDIDAQPTTAHNCTISEMRSQTASLIHQLTISNYMNIDNSTLVTDDNRLLDLETQIPDELFKNFMEDLLNKMLLLENLPKCDEGIALESPSKSADVLLETISMDDEMVCDDILNEGDQSVPINSLPKTPTFEIELMDNCDKTETKSDADQTKPIAQNHFSNSTSSSDLNGISSTDEKQLTETTIYETPCQNNIKSQVDSKKTKRLSESKGSSEKKGVEAVKVKPNKAPAARAIDLGHNSKTKVIVKKADDSNVVKAQGKKSFEEFLQEPDVFPKKPKKIKKANTGSPCKLIIKIGEAPTEIKGKELKNYSEVLKDTKTTKNDCEESVSKKTVKIETSERKPSHHKVKEGGSSHRKKETIAKMLVPGLVADNDVSVANQKEKLELNVTKEKKRGPCKKEYLECRVVISQQEKYNADLLLSKNTSKCEQKLDKHLNAVETHAKKNEKCALVKKWTRIVAPEVSDSTIDSQESDMDDNARRITTKPATNCSFDKALLDCDNVTKCKKVKSSKAKSPSHSNKIVDKVSLELAENALNTSIGITEVSIQNHGQLFCPSQIETSDKQLPHEEVKADVIGNEIIKKPVKTVIVSPKASIDCGSSLFNQEKKEDGLKNNVTKEKSSAVAKNDTKAILLKEYGIWYKDSHVRLTRCSKSLLKMYNATIPIKRKIKTSVTQLPHGIVRAEKSPIELKSVKKFSRIISPDHAPDDDIGQIITKPTKNTSFNRALNIGKVRSKSLDGISVKLMKNKNTCNKVDASGDNAKVHTTTNKVTNQLSLTESSKKVEDKNSNCEKTQLPANILSFPSLKAVNLPKIKKKAPKAEVKKRVDCIGKRKVEEGPYPGSMDPKKRKLEKEDVNDSENADVPEKKKYIPRHLVSEDPRENEDNNDPEWEELRKVSTDHERYHKVRERWRNLAIPDPSQDLTYRHRYALQPPRHLINVQRVNSARRHNRSRSCTSVFEELIEKAQESHEKRLARVKNLQEDETSMAYLQLSQKAWDGELDRQLDIMKDGHSRRLNQLSRELKQTIWQYEQYSKETRAFHAFYQGLNSEEDTTLLKPEQEMLLEDANGMYKAFQLIYTEY